MKKVEEKFDLLLKYRDQLDDTEQELFDILIQYGKEVMLSVESAV
jgi:hypothetical protein